MTDTIQLVLPSKSDYTSVLRVFLASLCGRLDYTVDDIETIKLAVSEAYTNSIKHAYKLKPLGPTTISIDVLPDELRIQVQDQGDGFDVNSVEKKHNFDALDSIDVGMGVGLTFMKSLMSAVTIESTLGHGTTVTLVKTHDAKRV